jgi:hypothetical protein
LLQVIGTIGTIASSHWYFMFCFKPYKFFLQEQDQKHSLDELQAQRQYATDLEKEIQALTEKSQLIEARHKQKVNIILAAIFNGKTTVNISDVQTIKMPHWSLVLSW